MDEARNKNDYEHASVRFETPGTAQLFRLSSVLNGLEGGASAMQQHVQKAANAIRSGTYTVDPLQLSRRIVGDALRTR